MADTLVSQFLERCETLPDKTAIIDFDGEEWVSQTFAEWHKRSQAVAASLIAQGVQPGDGVAIFSFTKRQWLEADMGIQLAGARTVTIYQSLCGETLSHILQDSQVSVVFAEGPMQVRALTERLAASDRPIPLRLVVYFESIQTPPHRPGKPAPPPLSIAEVLPKDDRLTLVPFEEFVSQGIQHTPRLLDEIEQRTAAVSPDTIAKIVYTSGTTGRPKGALLSHRNLTSVTGHLERTLGIAPSDTTLLFLPLAHVYAQLVVHAQLRIGFTVAIARSMLTAADDAAVIRPDFFAAVPRLFEKIHEAVQHKVEQANPIKRHLFSWAVSVGGKMAACRGERQAPGPVLRAQFALADRLVFAPLRQRLGGKVRFMISGGAPLSPAIMRFFEAAGLRILEGYGMTENASLTHHNHIDNYRIGSVGLPIPDLEVRIAEDGEILVRGPNVMCGYHNLPEETAATIDAQGWLHTGDIGTIDADGFLYITDRKKDIIVTSGGKNVAPAPIESKLARIPLVSQAVVFGNQRKYLVALLTVSPDAYAQWCAARNTPCGDPATDAELRRFLEAHVEAVNAGLERFETIKRFAVLSREFSSDHDEVTPSMKLRRRHIERRFHDVIASLYA